MRIPKKTKNLIATYADSKDSKLTLSSKDLKIMFRPITISSITFTIFSIYEEKIKEIMEFKRIIFGICVKNKRLNGSLMQLVC